MMRTIMSRAARMVVVFSVLVAAMTGASVGMAGAAPPAPASANHLSTAEAWTAAVSTPTGWCPLGKARKGGTGCRGGSLVPNVDVGSVGKTVGAVTVRCSIGTCSIYISRSATKKLNERGYLLVAGARSGAKGIVAVLGLAPPLAKLVVAAVTAHAWVARGTIKQAAENHGKKGACFKITKPHVPALGPYGMAINSYTHYSTNNGKYCKD